MESQPLEPGWEALPVGLPALGILEAMTDDSRATLSQYGTLQDVDLNQEVIREGAPQRRLYILVQGQMEILVHVNGKEVKLGRIYPGECIGEVCVLHPGPATATVRALEDNCIVWSMDAEDLRRYLQEHLGGGGLLLLGMAQCLSTRLRQANALITQHHLSAPIVSRPSKAISYEMKEEAGGFLDIFKWGSTAGKNTPGRPLNMPKIKISTEIKI